MPLWGVSLIVWLLLALIGLLAVGLLIGGLLIGGLLIGGLLIGGLFIVELRTVMGDCVSIASKFLNVGSRL